MNFKPNKLVNATLLTTLTTCFLSTSISASDWKTNAELQAERGNNGKEEVINTPSTEAEVAEGSLIKHKAASSITSGERLNIRTKIDGTEGVSLARVYFKSAQADKYNFVVLNKGDNGIYSANIPAAGNSIATIEYRIVTLNAFGEVFKTDKYSVAVNPNTSNSQPNKDGFIDVFSEYPEDETQDQFTGFVDNVRFTYGVTQLLASTGSSAAGVVSGTSASASSTAGTTAAATSPTGGLSTTAWVAGGTVIAGGVAAAGGSSSSSSSNDTESPDDPIIPSDQDTPDNTISRSSSDILVRLNTSTDSDTNKFTIRLNSDNPECGALYRLNTGAGDHSGSAGECSDGSDNSYTASSSTPFTTLFILEKPVLGNYDVSVELVFGGTDVDYTLTINGNAVNQGENGTRLETDPSKWVEEQVTSFSLSY